MVTLNACCCENALVKKTLDTKGIEKHFAQAKNTTVVVGLNIFENDKEIQCNSWTAQLIIDKPI